ncbi:hypothetical protein GGI03_001998, partial [Coemansia sp. RSA 2337]
MSNYPVNFKRNVLRKLQEDRTINAFHLSIDEFDGRYIGLRIFSLSIVSGAFIGMTRDMRAHLVTALLRSELASK